MTIEVVSLPYNYVFSQNYPNPFNPVTQIEYGIPKESHVRLSIFDILGKEVVTLVNGLEKSGYRSVRWNGMDKKVKVVGAGMYFYVIQAENFKKVKKMVRLK